MKVLFRPRTECPSSDNVWYCRKGHGGDSPCIAGKPEKWPGSVLANCVGYTFGRVAEVLDGFIKIGYSYGEKPYSAHKWYGAKDGLERGKTPRLGAVACWVKTDGKSGHVCNVEKIYEDGSWQSSESAYNGAAWKTRKYNKNSARSGFKFQGFIYLPAEIIEYDPSPDPRPIPGPTDLKVGDKVEIVGTGHSSSNGGISTNKPIGWTREILGILPNRRFPYKVGSGKVTTAWYDASALKKK